jgi:5'-phosphate synthase pdxT subunit
MIVIGILALQGAFIEHKNILDRLNIKNILIKKADEIQLCDGIILPGGESTSIGIIEKNIFDEIREHIKKGKAIWGICAGMILLSNNIIGQKIGGQKSIGGLDVVIERNFFGSQLNSFIKSLEYPTLFKKNGYFDAIFIRGPVIQKIDKNIQILSKLDNDIIIAVQQNNVLGTSFHPELTNDYSWHEYFIKLIENKST